MGNFENAKVKVSEGWLQGYIDENLKVWKGIPYAAPPVGELRFRHPQDPYTWRGVRQATQYQAGAIQPVQEQEDLVANVHGIPQLLMPSQYQEDCLYLNVWSPAKTEDAKLPVFVWIHGGGMIAGSGVECVCAGEGLAKRKDLVVVTINYRLGFYGFFAHPELTEEGGGSSGNYAFFDMVKACEWIKKNIAVFGGDPDNITIAGQSGGARSTGILLASPLMKGLVRRVSIESGVVYWGFAKPQPREVMEQKGVEFMKKIGVESIAELRKMDAWELFDLYNENTDYFSGFSFCIDRKLLPENYEQWMDAGKFNDFEVMMGSCAQEFPAAPNGLSIEEYHKYLEETFPDNVEKMKEWYPAKTEWQAAKMVTTIASDIMLAGAIRIGELCHQYGRKAYVWHMNKENEDERGHRDGCPHCAEMPYLFGRVDKGSSNPFLDYKWVEEDYRFMNVIQGYWANYATTGDPNGEGLPEWKPYEKDFDVVTLGNEISMFPESEFEKYQYIYDYVKVHGNPRPRRFS